MIYPQYFQGRIFRLFLTRKFLTLSLFLESDKFSPGHQFEFPDSCTCYFQALNLHAPFLQNWLIGNQKALTTKLVSIGPRVISEIFLDMFASANFNVL